jgi:type IV pilus biogenesis protein CpaD/CtpE
MKKVILTVMTIATLSACNQSKSETQNKMEETKPKTGLIELTTFKLNKEVESIDFVKSAEQMQRDFLNQQKGFIKRTLTCSGDTLWTDIVYWENAELQSNAMKLAEKSTQIMPFMEKIDFSSVKMTLTKPMFTTE